MESGIFEARRTKYLVERGDHLIKRKDRFIYHFEKIYVFACVCAIFIVPLHANSKKEFMGYSFSVP